MNKRYVLVLYTILWCSVADGANPGENPKDPKEDDGHVRLYAGQAYLRNTDSTWENHLEYSVSSMNIGILPQIASSQKQDTVLESC